LAPTGKRKNLKGFKKLNRLKREWKIRIGEITGELLENKETIRSK